VTEKRTAINAVKRKTSLETFWESMTPVEKKSWPKELDRIVKQETSFRKGLKK